MNLAAALCDRDRPADAAALRDTTGDLTVGDLRRRAGRMQQVVQEHAQPGDRIAVLSGNSGEFVAAYLGILAAGAVAVPLNPIAPAAEVRRELDLVEPVAIVAADAFVDVARRAARECATYDVEELLAGIDANTPELAPIDRAPEDLAALLFTTGVGGPPKAAMLTHGSLLANLEQLQGHPGLALRADDVGLVVLPCFHVFGLNVALGLPLYAGATCAIVSHFHPAESLTRMRDDRVTVVAGVPAMFDAWLALSERDAPTDAFATVRLVVSGAAALPIATANALRERFGIEAHEGYGLTEASPVVTTSAVAAHPRPGSIGPPLPGVDVRVVDHDGLDVLAGDPGEVLVRGPNVFAGYWNDPEATAVALTSDGWLRTGDVAVADDDGWLSLVDRAKDTVIVSGFNVFPGEVEEAIAQHDGVADVVVVGEPHPRTGETLVAYVVAATSPPPDPVELVRYAGRRLARYKLPTRVEFVSEVPRVFAGKLVRRAAGSLSESSESSSAT